MELRAEGDVEFSHFANGCKHSVAWPGELEAPDGLLRERLERNSDRDALSLAGLEGFLQVCLSLLFPLGLYGQNFVQFRRSGQVGRVDAHRFLELAGRVIHTAAGEQTLAPFDMENSCIGTT